jgi:hypothetical protein
MGSFKKFIGNFIPDSLMTKYVQFKRNRRWKNKSAEEVFTSIYNSKGWGGHQSVSGRGSDDDQTATIAQAIPGIITQFNIKSMLDIPCGDFHWMKNVELGAVKYIGSDIVAEIVTHNNTTYGSPKISFSQLDLIAGPLPQVDLVFCRDCLVHFSFAHITSALNSIVDSKSAYLATTSFNQRTQNDDIVTGNWRALNLRAAPFNLPKPLLEIDEKCTEGENQFADKTMSVWKVSDIEHIIRKLRAV